MNSRLDRRTRSTLGILWRLLACAWTPTAVATEREGWPIEEAALEPMLGDLAATLSRSASPRHKLITARLRFGAGPEGSSFVPWSIAANQFDPDVPDASALVADALRSGASDPLVWWTVANACPAPAPACDRRGAIEHLQRIAPSNAAVWMLCDEASDTESTVDAAESDARDDRDLDRIAASSRFDIYVGETMRAYFEAFDHLTVPNDVRIGSPGLARDEAVEHLRGMLAFSLAMFDALPALGRLVPLCAEDTLERLGTRRREKCMAAMRTAWKEADSLLTSRLALAALIRLTPAGDGREAMMRANYRLSWQSAAWMELHQKAEDAGEAARVRHFKDLHDRWREPGATELDVMRGQLASAGIPLDPPPDWKPSLPFAPLPPSAAD